MYNLIKNTSFIEKKLIHEDCFFSRLSEKEIDDKKKI